MGIQTTPSLSGAALKGMRLGPGMSYSTYTMFIASSVYFCTRFLYCGISSGDFGRIEFGPKSDARYEDRSSTTWSLSLFARVQPITCRM